MGGKTCRSAPRWPESHKNLGMVQTLVGTVEPSGDEVEVEQAETGRCLAIIWDAHRKARWGSVVRLPHGGCSGSERNGRDSNPRAL